MITCGSVLEDRYRIEKKLGTGGNSTVYEAVHLHTGRKLAVKEIGRNSLNGSSEKRMQILKNLHHSGIPTILDVLETEEASLVIMVFIEGNTLQQEIEKRDRENRRFSLEEVLQIGIGICEILDYLHSLPEPVLYRDIKPSNIMICPDDRIVLVDLGTVCFCHCADEDLAFSEGTPGYAPPEQYRNEPDQGPESDLYSVGAVLHQLITGINPAKNLFVFEKITKADPELLRLYRKKRRQLLGLEKILIKCTRFRRDYRYSDAERLLRDLLNPSRCLHSGKCIHTVHGFMPGIFLSLAVFFGLLSVQADYMTGKVRQDGKDYCLMKARRVEEDQADQWVEAALAFSPGDAVCFTVMLDRLLEDGILSGTEHDRIRVLLNKTAEGEMLDHEALLQKKPEPFFRFAYRMGTACMYASEGVPDYTEADDWFRSAVQAGEQWETEDNKKEKQVILKRISILTEICEYRIEIFTGNIYTDSYTSPCRYWENLTSLLDEDVPGDNLLVTELGLWREILGILSEWPSELRNSGISWKEQKKVSDRISNLTSALLNSGKADDYPYIKEQLKQLEETEEAVDSKRVLLEEAENTENRRHTGENNLLY